MLQSEWLRYREVVVKVLNHVMANIARYSSLCLLVNTLDSSGNRNRKLDQISELEETARQLFVWQKPIPKFQQLDVSILHTHCSKWHLKL